jgi:hypothetical protein
VLIEFGLFDSGDDKGIRGTITDAVSYHFAPKDVRRHHLISISYISLLPCHGTGHGVAPLPLQILKNSWHMRGSQALILA